MLIVHVSCLIDRPQLQAEVSEPVAIVMIKVLRVVGAAAGPVDDAGLRCFAVMLYHVGMVVCRC